MAAASHFSIVGIGASAGGVEALGAFFTAMPAENGMAFVVVTHLAPNHDSWLAEIISRSTTMPVSTARDGDEVEPQHVYVLPPGAIITIESGHLHLRERGSGHRERGAIDIFFTSLAEDQGEDAVGVVLSGGGSDGSFGIAAIKEHGGLTLAQGSGREALRFKDMPENAAATGLVDFVLPVEQMPERLLSCIRNANAVESERMSAAAQTICALLRTRLGHDFSEYKDKTFGRRVQRRMQVLQLTTIESYVERLQNDPNEITLLFRDLLIGVTSFLRDAEAFQALETLVIPKIFEGKAAEQEVRVWVPACSTGEEAYSIAILLREQMDKLQVTHKVQIFATDIDERAMTVARTGLYPESLMANIPPERLAKHFVREGQFYRVKKEMRDMCVFAPHNVLRDPPFSRLDLISCRNLLIYLKAELQARLIPVFHYALRPDGFLFLGLSETIARQGDLFAALDKRYRIFQRRNLVTPLSNSVLPYAPRGKGLPAPARLLREPGELNTDFLRLATATVMEKFAPAHVVVNEAGEVLHYSTRTGKYLEPAFGAPGRDLFAMARQGLRPDLRAALHKAAETRRSVMVDGIVVNINGGGAQTISLTVQPITADDDTAFLIVFTDAGPIRPRDDAASHDLLPPAGDAAVQQLERELQEAKQRLQATIEEWETSNEELKSSNEELEASKEETQSINEELQTANADLNRKVTELDQSNSDLRNVFESTQVGTIFLDRDLVIRSFTPAATEIYSLVPGDRGRPLQDLVSRLDDQNVEQDIREMFTQQRPVEHRVSVNKGAAHYLMRILPYHATGGAIDGALVTFTDITSIIASEEHQKMLVAELSHRVKNTLTVVASMASRTGAHVRTVEAFLETFLGRLHSLASTHDLLSQCEWADVRLRRVIELGLAPYAGMDGTRLEVNGPPVLLKPRAAVAFGMVIHELATNSLKYGALSGPDGRLQVTWAPGRPSPAPELELHWLESGGPEVAPPVKRGFGTDFIERALRFELDGEANLAFEKSGLSCTITLPLRPGIAAALPETPMSGASHGST